MGQKESLEARAVLKARQLILLALENGDTTALEHLVRLQDMLRNLDLRRLLEDARKKESRSLRP
jgi:hypothetical protein